MFVHPSAIVDPPRRIGFGTRVWHHAHVMAGARIGRGCVLGQGVFVASSARIGDRCRIQNHVSVFDGVTLGDAVFVGPSAVFTNVLTPRVEHPRRDSYVPTRVKKGATIGANATILCGVEIGAYAMIGAGAVVTRDVPDHALVMGVPARIAGWACRCGERLAGRGRSWTCDSCGDSYTRRGSALVPGSPRRSARPAARRGRGRART